MPDPTDRPELPYLLDITTLAGHLGVEARHIRRLVFERRIPYIKWGHLIRFDPTEINTWLDQNRQRTGSRTTGVPTRATPISSSPRRRPAQAEPPAPFHASTDGRLPGDWPGGSKESA